MKMDGQKLFEQSEALQSLWNETVGRHAPPLDQCWVWIQRHPYDVCEYAIRETAKRFARYPEMSADHLIRFCSSVANSRKSFLEAQRNKKAA